MLDDQIVNAHQRITVPGLYAIDGVVREVNQIGVAAGQGAIAAPIVRGRVAVDAKHVDEYDRMRLHSRLRLRRMTPP